MKADDDALLKLYAMGLSVDECASLYGCCTQTVYNVLARNSFELRDRRQPSFMLRAVEWDVVARDYSGTEMAVVEILEKHHIATHELYQYLALRPDIKSRRERKFTRRRKDKGLSKFAFGGKARMLPKQELDDAVQAYLDGWVVRVILSVWNIGYGTLYNELDLRGIPRRVDREGRGYGR